MDTQDVLVIGAGITGLICASELQAAGQRVLVLDKGRGPGGRMSTRWGMGEARIDHGAQFFTVREARWGKWVERMRAAGVVKEWFRQAPWDNNPAGYPRYCGVDGMNAVPKYLAADLELVRSCRIVSLQRVEGIWIAESGEGERYAGRELVLSAPLPQAWTLLNTSGLQWADDATRAVLEQVRYEKGLAALVRLKGASAVPAPGCLKPETGALVWIADNQQKGNFAGAGLDLARERGVCGGTLGQSRRGTRGSHARSGGAVVGLGGCRIQLSSLGLYLAAQSVRKGLLPECRFKFDAGGRCLWGAAG
jgi:predicted NAD/FAD-dependent oxidoreductase